MLKMKKYFSKKKYVLLFLVVLGLFGSIAGALIGISNLDMVREDLSYFAANSSGISYNYMLIHFFFLVISFASSFFGIGIPILCTLFFYEGLSFGFLISIFTATNAILGFFYSIIFFLFTKGVYILLLALFFFKCLEIARRMIGSYLYKSDPSSFIMKLMTSSGILIFLTFLNDLFVYFLSNKILNLFHFLI